MTNLIKFYLFGTHKLTANYYLRLIISTYNISYLVKYAHVLDCKLLFMKFR